MSARTRQRSGFTLFELMLVVSLAGILAAAGGALYLEGRVSTTRIEVQLQLQRDAALAAEALGRDLRGAQAVTAKDGGIDVVPTGGGEVRWRIEEDRLVRTEGSGAPWVVARHAERIGVEPWDERGWDVHLGLARELLPGRTVRADREVLVRRAVR